MGLTPIIGPDGMGYKIPTANVPDALKAGGKLATPLLGPDGAQHLIPNENVDKALQAGGRPIAPVPLPGPLATTNNEDALKELKAQGIKYPGPDFKPSWAPDGMTPSQYLTHLKSGESLELPAQMLGAAATGPIAAGVKGIAGVAARTAAAGAGTGLGEAVAGGSSGQVASAAVGGAVSQPLAEGASAVASKVAPALAESALRITANMRGRGRTIGDAVLANTSGLTAPTLHEETQKAIGALMDQLDSAADTATQQGVTGSTQTAHDALNDAISSIPRNAKTILDKANGLHDLLDLPGSVPGSTTYTPTELLEMKRGVGMEMNTWPPEWKTMKPVQAIKAQIYGALDGELDKIVPGSQDINQTISSLIPAKQQAKAISGGASIAQLMAHRLAAHTGAAATSIAGGVYGGEKGGLPGALAGATAGLVIPEVLAGTSGQMAAARLINALGEKATAPEVLPIIKALAGSGASQESK